MGDKNVAGWVYIITNKSLRGLLKVGFTEGDPAARASQLSHTGIPHPYEVCFQVHVDDPRDAERRAHDRLHEFHEGKEWFRCDVEYAMDVLAEIAGNAPPPQPVEMNWGSPYIVRCEKCGYSFGVTLPQGSGQARCRYCGNLSTCEDRRRDWYRL